VKISEIRERTDEELRTLVKQLERDLYKLRVQKATNQLEDTGSVDRLRKDIARALTVLRARELQAQAVKQPN
jgi:large subunit ribosomal protein L29